MRPGLTGYPFHFALIVFPAKGASHVEHRKKLPLIPFYSDSNPFLASLFSLFDPASTAFQPTVSRRLASCNLSSLAVSAPAFADGAGSAWIPFLPSEMVRAHRPIHHKQVRGLTVLTTCSCVGGIHFSLATSTCLEGPTSMVLFLRTINTGVVVYEGDEDEDEDTKKSCRISRALANYPAQPCFLSNQPLGDSGWVAAHSGSGGAVTTTTSGALR